jgi:hypothetical protein
MLFLNKLLPVFVLPVGWVAFSLILFAMWKKKRWPLVAALVVLYLSSIPLVGSRLIGWVESRNPAVPLAQVEPADADRGAGRDTGAARLKPELRCPISWILPNGFDAGVILLQAGKARTLVFTGARMSWRDTAATEGDELKRIAETRGVPAERILGHAPGRKHRGRGGRRGGADEDPMAGGASSSSPPAGTWRAQPTSSREAGVDCTLFPVDFRLRPGARGWIAIDFLPRGEAWQQTETALRECYGRLFYRIFR